MELVVAVAIFVLIIMLVFVVIPAIPVIGGLFDFLAEIASGPRFLTMGIGWVMSENYRQEIRREHSKRVKVLAWLEYILAALCLFGWFGLLGWLSFELAYIILSEGKANA
ncbi:hypothetical protein KFE80_00290 [bacterium SCSIO 12696]|nr:hypothetical protein KFE80_00290 [bacterium SCSIO 12696]